MVDTPAAAGSITLRKRFPSRPSPRQSEPYLAFILDHGLQVAAINLRRRGDDDRTEKRLPTFCQELVDFVFQRLLVTCRYDLITFDSHRVGFGVGGERGIRTPDTAFDRITV